jgi:hypothetical protein
MLIIPFESTCRRCPSRLNREAFGKIQGLLEVILAIQVQGQV